MANFDRLTPPVIMHAGLMELSDFTEELGQI